MTDTTVVDPALTLSESLIAQLTELLGPDGIEVDRPKVDEFKDPYWVPDDDTYAASAVVQPTSTEQVQEIMRLANEFLVPVWPHSQGRNNGYGGPSPRVRGSIQIGFRRMNKVLEINEELAYAVVEPGVRWFDLHAALEEQAPGLTHSVPDIGWGSLIGNSMDSGITYMPYGADYMLPCGMEVVLPSGELLRTGHGAIPGGKSWHVYKRNLGPTLEPLFIQSNLGIVTKMGVWLKRKPEAYAPLILSIGEDADLALAIDTIRELRLAGHLEGVPSLYPTLRAAVMLTDDPVVTARRQLTPEEYREIGIRTGVGAWAARAAVWGDRDIAELKIAKIKAAWEKIPSGRFVLNRIYSPEEYGEITLAHEKIQAGIPTLKAVELTPDHVGHVGFSPVVPMSGEQVRFVVDELRTRILAHGLNFSGGILITGERSCVIVCGMQFDHTDGDSVRNAMSLAKLLVKELGELGYGEYRAHLDFMDLASDQYSFNDHAYRRFVESIKDAVDPNGILSPGRHGIWPHNRRNERSA
ncbi:FAD-binding oxidoreductase [Diaminobutyricibacter sp. McL0618]|uniref:FAD-binding oxidoreductase n=1 Tax=Leifsonia sp. McL0618 TaxID=3415677 RepID=UPI003CE784B3